MRILFVRNAGAVGCFCFLFVYCERICRYKAARPLIFMKYMWRCDRKLQFTWGRKMCDRNEIEKEGKGFQYKKMLDVREKSAYLAFSMYYCIKISLKGASSQIQSN